MILNVRVIPNAKRSDIEELKPGCLRIHLCAPAVDNKANKALVETLASHYEVKKSEVVIVRGERSRDKVVEIGKVT